MIAENSSKDYSEKLVVNIDLAEQVILKTDKEGNQLLEIGVHLGFDEPVSIKFPTVGMWDTFCTRIIYLFELFRRGAADAIQELTYEAAGKIDLNNIDHWLYLSQYALRDKRVSEDMIDIFTRYLSPRFPSVDGMELTTKQDQRYWLRTKAPIDCMIRVFAAVVSIEDWVKKNANYLLEKIFQIYHMQNYSASSQKSGPGLPDQSTNDLSSSYVSL